MMRLIPGAVTVELGSRQIRASALIEHDGFWRAARCPIEAELAIARRLGFRTPSAKSRRTTCSGPCGRRLSPGAGPDERLRSRHHQSADQRV